MVSKRPQRTAAELAERYRLKVDVYRRDRGLCFYCDEPRTFKEMTMDHIKPECHGGRLEYDNIVCACFECNHERGNMPAHIYLTLKMTA